MWQLSNAMLIDIYQAVTLPYNKNTRSLRMPAIYMLPTNWMLIDLNRKV